MNLTDVVQPTLVRDRTSDEINVVASIAEMMHNANYVLADSWLKEQDIQEIALANSDLQRFLINRNLRIKLGMAKVNTSLERFALEASVSMDEYLENIRKYIIPALVIISTQLN